MVSVKGRDGLDDRPTTVAAEQEAGAADAVEQHYRKLLDHTPDAICVHQDGRVVYVNSVAVRRMGARSTKQIVGHLITDFVHPHSIPPMLARIAMLHNNGDASAHSEAVIIALDATTIDVEVISVLILWEGRPAYQVVFRDLTAQKAALATLHYQATLINHVSDAIIATTATGIVTNWNPAAETIYGRQAAKALALPISEAVGAPLDPPAIIAGGGVAHTIHHAANGTALAVRVSAAAMDNGYVLVCSDHTALQHAEQRFRTVVDSLDEGIVVIRTDGQVESANPAATRILGITHNDGPASHPGLAMSFRLYDEHGQPLPPDQSPVSVVLRTGRDVKRILGVDRADGQRIWLFSSCRLLNPAEPSHSAALLSFVDITAEHTAKQRLTYQASHDALTGLPNRNQLVDRAKDALTSTNPPLSAVMFIDLDHLKAINDSLGHHTGDHVLQLTAQRLRDALRADDIVGRPGGDEFVALLTHPLAAADAELLAQRLHAAVAEPVAVEGHAVQVSISIGITIIEPTDTRGVDELLRDADVAMYAAKTAGRSQTRFFSTELALNYPGRRLRRKCPAPVTKTPACP